MKIFLANWTKKLAGVQISSPAFCLAPVFFPDTPSNTHCHNQRCRTQRIYGDIPYRPLHRLNKPVKHKMNQQQHHKAINIVEYIDKKIPDNLLHHIKRPVFVHIILLSVRIYPLESIPNGNQPTKIPAVREAPCRPPTKNQAYPYKSSPLYPIFHRISTINFSFAKNRTSPPCLVKENSESTPLSLCCSPCQMNLPPHLAQKSPPYSLFHLQL